ncbi:RCC1 domain-containing protein [Leucobacter chromiireducens]|uniref:RCC1 domain-containing protein n=1 Tax=Leucobacter chromiireducens TaxID=283877 RepID=UPI000F63E6B7|nr:hypothetical protein [Leucobacter chromiireducens]
MREKLVRTRAPRRRLSGRAAAGLAVASMVALGAALPVALTSAAPDDSAYVNWPVGSDYERPTTGDTAPPTTTPPTTTPPTTTPPTTTPPVASGGGVPVSNFENRFGLYRSGGSWYGYGMNLGSQQGHGTNPVSNPVTVAALNQAGIVEVSIAGSNGLGLDGSGRLWSWGSPSAVLGVTPSSTQAPTLVPGLGGTTFKSISLGGLVNNAATSHTAVAAAVDSNGDLWTWGKPTDSRNVNNFMLADGGGARSQPKKVLTGYNFTRVVLGAEAGGAIDVNKRLWTWGKNTWGGLGNTSDLLATRSTPQMLSSVTNVVDLSFGHYTSHALDANGAVYSWGKNNHNAVGTTATCGFVDGISSCPVKVGGLPAIAQISSGFEHTVMLSKTGEMWTFGTNENGHHGNNTRSLGGNGPSGPVRTTTPAGAATITGVLALYAGSMALDANGVLYTWGTNTGTNLALTGLNSSQLGNRLTQACDQLLPQKPQDQTFSGTCKAPN